MVRESSGGLTAPTTKEISRMTSEMERDSSFGAVAMLVAVDSVRGCNQMHSVFC